MLVSPLLVLGKCWMGRGSEMPLLEFLQVLHEIAYSPSLVFGLLRHGSSPKRYDVRSGVYAAEHTHVCSIRKANHSC